MIFRYPHDISILFPLYFNTRPPCSSGHYYTHVEPPTGLACLEEELQQGIEAAVQELLRIVEVALWALRAPWGGGKLNDDQSINTPAEEFCTKRIIGLCCCHFVVRVASGTKNETQWRAQDTVVFFKIRICMDMWF